MASRTKQKEEARARRLAEERARSEKARRDRRLRMVGGVVVLAIAIAAVLVAVSSGSSTNNLEKGLATGAVKNNTVTTVNNLLAGVPQSGATLGDPNAPVTMDYYGDLECPICQEFTLQGGLSQLIANEVRQGKVKIVYKAFETATRDPNVFEDQQVAALAAGMQKKFWNYAELFYHEQGQEDTGYVTESYLDSLAEQTTGLNLVKWESDRNNQSLTTQVIDDVNQGKAIGVTGTPTLVFIGPKGKAASPESVPTYSQLQQVIKQVS
ncbi:MAG: DsbA family protein [Solirubrobacteraceae bacterium]